jgi:integrase/recombinase XerD
MDPLLPPGPEPTPVPAKAKRKKRKLPVFLSQEEADRLVAAAVAPRDRLIVLCGLLLGLRVSEICGLRIERIDFSRGQVLIYQGKGGKDRYLPLHSRLSEPLQTWIAGRAEGWLFPSPKRKDQPLTTRAVQYLVQRLADQAGIRRPDPTQRISPHKLRHSFASRLVEKGVDIVSVRDLMGHSSVAVTQVYLHCDSNRLRSEIARL